MSWLEQAVEERDPWAVYIEVEPAFAGLRTDARFQQIVEGRHSESKLLNHLDK